MESGSNGTDESSAQGNIVQLGKVTSGVKEQNKATVNNTRHKLKIHPIIAKTIESCRISATQANSNSAKLLHKSTNKQHNSNKPNKSEPKKANHIDGDLKKELIFNRKSEQEHANLLTDLKLTDSKELSETKIAKNNNSAKKRTKLPIKSVAIPPSIGLELQQQSNTDPTISNKQQAKKVAIEQTIAKEKLITSDSQINNRLRKTIKQIDEHKENSGNRFKVNHPSQEQDLKGDHYVYACNGFLDLAATAGNLLNCSRPVAKIGDEIIVLTDGDSSRPASSLEPEKKEAQVARTRGRVARKQIERSSLDAEPNSVATNNNEQSGSKSTFRNPMQVIEAKYFHLDEDELNIGNHKLSASNKHHQQQTLHLRPSNNLIVSNCDCATNSILSEISALTASSQHKASCLAFGRPVKTEQLGNKKPNTQTSSSKLIGNQFMSQNNDPNWLLIQQQHQLHQLQQKQPNSILHQTMFDQNHHHHHHHSSQQQLGQPGFYYASGTTSGSSLSEQTCLESSSSPPPPTHQPAQSQQQRNLIQQHQQILNQKPLHSHQQPQSNQMSILMSNYQNQSHLSHLQHHNQHQAHNLIHRNLNQHHHDHHSGSSLIGRIGSRLRHFLCYCCCCCCLTSTNGRCDSKCFTNTLMVITILIFIIVSSFSIYLTLPQSPTSLKNQFAALSGRLKVDSRGDNFVDSLLNRTSGLFQLKQVQYETILRGALDRSSSQLRSLSNHLVRCEVYSFRPGSLWVHFRLHLNKESLMNDPMLRQRKAHDEQLETHFLPRLTQQTIHSGLEQLMSNGSNATTTTSNTRSVRSQHQLVTSKEQQRHLAINSTAELHSLKSFDDQIMRLMPIIEHVDLQSILVTPEFDMLAMGAFDAMSENWRSSGQFQNQAKSSEKQAPVEFESANRPKPTQAPVSTTTSTNKQSTQVATLAEKDATTTNNTNHKSTPDNTFTLFNYKHTLTRPSGKPVAPITTKKQDFNISTPELDDLDPFLRNQAPAKQPNYNVIGPSGNLLVQPVVSSANASASPKVSQDSKEVVKLSSGQPLTVQHKAEPNHVKVELIRNATSSQRNQKLISSTTPSNPSTTSTTTSTTSTTNRPLLLESSASIQELWNNALSNSSNRTAIRQHQQHQPQDHFGNSNNSRRPNIENTTMTTTTTTTTSTTTSTNRPPKVSPLQHQGGSMIIGMNAKLQQKQQKLVQNNGQQSAVILNSETSQSNSTNNANANANASAGASANTNNIKQTNGQSRNFANTFKSKKQQSQNSAQQQIKPPLSTNNNNSKLAKLATFVQQNKPAEQKPSNSTSRLVAPSGHSQHHQPVAMDLSRTMTRVQILSPHKPTAKPSSSTTSPTLDTKPTIVVFLDTTTTTTTSSPSSFHRPNVASVTMNSSQPSATTTMANLYASLMNQNAQTTRPGTSIFSSQWRPINMTALIAASNDADPNPNTPKLIQIGSGQSAEQVAISQVASLQGSQSPFAMPMPSMVAPSHQPIANATSVINPLAALQTDLKPIRSHRQNSTQNRKPNQRIVNTLTLLAQAPALEVASRSTPTNSDHFGFESHRVSGVRTLYRNNNNRAELQNNNRFVDDFAISTPGGAAPTSTESLGSLRLETTTQATSSQNDSNSNVLLRTLDAFSFQTLSLNDNNSSALEGNTSQLLATTPLSLLVESGQLPNLHPHHKRLIIEQKRQQKHKQLGLTNNIKKQAKSLNFQDDRFSLIGNVDEPLTTQPSVLVTSTSTSTSTINNLNQNFNRNVESDKREFLIDDQMFENRRGSSSQNAPVSVIAPSDTERETSVSVNMTQLTQCRFHGCKAKDSLEYVCLNNNQICDEFIDCQDESDEHDCVSLLKYDNFQPNRLSFSNGAGIIYLNRRGSLAPMCIDYADEQESVLVAQKRGAQESELKQIRRESQRKQEELVRQINTMGQYACSLQSFNKLISFKVNDHQSVDDMNLIRDSKLYHRLSIVSNQETSNNKRFEQTTSFDAYKSGTPELKVLMSTSSECPSQRTVFVKCGSFECGLDSFSVRDNKNPEKIREGVINDSPWLVKLYHLGSQACHGYLIDEMWLISFRQCFANYPDSSPLDWTAEISYEHYGNDYYRSIESNRRSISSIFANRDPLNPDSSGDIVLAKLETPVRFSPLNRPICLPPESAVVANKSSQIGPINRSDLYQDCFTATLPFYPKTKSEQQLQQSSLAKQDLLLSKVKFNRLSDCFGDDFVNQNEQQNLLCLTQLSNRSTTQFPSDATRVLICSTKQVSRSGSKWTVVAFQKSRLSQALEGGKQLYTTIASQMDWIIDTMNPRTGQPMEFFSPTSLIGTNSPFELTQVDPFRRLTTPNPQQQQDQSDNLPRTMSSANNMDFEHQHPSSSFLINQGLKRQICNQYKCSTGECLSWAKTCDGSYDCPDHDDEKYCHR